MAMEHLSFHKELIADLSSNNENCHFVLFHIIQHAQVSGTQFELNQWIGAKLLDIPRLGLGLMDQLCLNGCFQLPLLTGSQTAQLRFSFGSYRNPEGHRDYAIYVFFFRPLR
jgi:hypothetical protein